MYPLPVVLFLVLAVLVESWIARGPFQFADNKRISFTARFAADDSWQTKETWTQQRMRTFWEREPHTIVTSHVQRMISSHSSLLNSTKTMNGTTIDDAEHYLVSFDRKSPSEIEPDFGAFYNGEFPTVNHNASLSIKQRKKISYRLDFAYDGTQFAGWQRQNDAKLMTVQECVEDYLGRLTGEGTVDVRVAGRTDSGVHAVGQVGRVRLQQPLLQSSIFMEALCVWSISQVSSEFHPSFGSSSRSYVYLVDATALNGLLGFNAQGKQDDLLELVARINGILEPLVGEELDYYAFSYGRIKTETTLCSLSRANARLVSFQKKSDNDLADHSGSSFAVAIELTGNRFLRRMVRILVATVFQMAVFPNSYPHGLLKIVQSRDRSQTAPPAPAAGLVFIGADCETKA